MTVAEYFAAHATEGRAFLRGRASTDRAWISKASAHGRSTFWLCRDNAEGIDLLDPLMDTRFVRTASPKQSKAWHQRMRRSTGYLQTA